MSKTIEKFNKYYECRLMGGNMLMYFDNHDTYEKACLSATRNKKDGKIRHYIIFIMPIEEINLDLQSD